MFENVSTSSWNFCLGDWLPPAFELPCLSRVRVFDVLTWLLFWLPLADYFRKKPLRVLWPAPTIANRVQLFSGCAHLWVSRQALFGADCFNSPNGICHLEVGIYRVLKPSTFIYNSKTLLQRLMFLAELRSGRDLLRQPSPLRPSALRSPSFRIETLPWLVYFWCRC